VSLLTALSSFLDKIMFTLYLNSSREMGGALSEYYTNVKPKMNDFDINVR
jgi:hypothetical protein